jgi:hypothetical protein
MDIKNIVKKHLLEALEEEGGQKPENYMFFGNIEQMARQCKLLMQEDHTRIDSILKEHDWAQDHIAEAKSLLDQVFDFLMNETSDVEDSLNEAKEDIDESKNNPTNAKLWSRAKSLAKSKFKVYPSAYANGWAAKWYKKQGGSWRKSKK